jgi:hypothetical protein
MKIPQSPFTVTDWSTVPATEHPGETGVAIWRTVNVGELRIRHVEYSADYLADHWCDLEGELVSELRDGRKSVMTAGTSYHVSDFGDPAHRSYSKNGAKIFIVD